MSENFMKNSFEPIIDNNSKILILGSLPSDKSIEKHEYYENKTNQFWNIISMCFDGEKINFNNYDEKIAYLHEHHIALWDVYSRANRKGSLDSNIKNAEFNDIKNLLKLYPSIVKIVTNGRASQKGFEKYLKLNNFDFDYHYVPSSSSLNVSLNFEEKVLIWKKIIIEKDFKNF